MNKKICILGSARNGKDTVAEMINKQFGYTFQSSSIAVAEIVMMPLLAPKYGYKTVEECFLDRVNHRQEWFEAIQLYNKPDATKLAYDIFKISDIYVGMRSDVEFQACKAKGLFDLVIGVYDPRKPIESKESMTIDMWKESDMVIPNSGSIEDLRDRIIKLKPLFI